MLINITRSPTIGTLDRWANDVEDDFWLWNNSFPAYKKSVTFQPPDFDKIGHDFNITWDPTAFTDGEGPLHVSYGNYFGPLGPYLQTAMDASGLKALNGCQSGSLIGYCTLAATINIDTVTRDSSESSFLQYAARKSPGLKIYPQTMVKRVLFDNKRAAGVEVQLNSINSKLRYHLNARKEVILSAGQWRSPQLLMASGIGPADQLRRHGITTIQHLPGVGRNVWESQSRVSVTTIVDFFLGSSFSTTCIYGQCFD